MQSLLSWKSIWKCCLKNIGRLCPEASEFIIAWQKGFICISEIITCFVLSYFQISHTKQLTHWGRVTHICVGKLTIIGSYNGLSPGRRQAIIGINVGILSIGPLGTNFKEIWSEIHSFSFKKMHLKLSSAKWRPSCLGLNELTHIMQDQIILVQHSQYHDCWCPDSLHHQDISISDNGYIDWVSSSLTWRRISATFVVSVWRNDTIYRYIFMPPMKNLGGQGFILLWV